MGRKKIETIINGKIKPYELNGRARAEVAQLARKYPYDFLIECIDIGVSSYFRYDEEGNVTRDSVNKFLSKLGGIAYNRSRTEIEQEIIHTKNICSSKFYYWNETEGTDILSRYVEALRRKKWSDDIILYDLRTEVRRLCNTSKNWTQWSSNMEHWIEEINLWTDEDDYTIVQSESILPESLFNGLSHNFQVLCKEINASYEHNLYDCTAVIMRRLLEGLLVLSFQNNDIENEIVDTNGYHESLDKIIKKAEQNTTLKLSKNTKNNMKHFKELGNYSAHKIWFNSTKKDIEPHILEYRVIIEELLYKAGLR